MDRQSGRTDGMLSVTISGLGRRLGSRISSRDQRRSFSSPLTFPQPTLVRPLSVLYQRCISCSLYQSSLSPSSPQTPRPTPTEITTPPAMLMTPSPDGLLETLPSTSVSTTPGSPSTMSECKKSTPVRLFPAAHTGLLQGRLRSIQRRERLHCRFEYPRAYLPHSQCHYCGLMLAV